MNEIPIIYAGCMVDKPMHYQSALPLQKVMLHAASLTNEQRLFFRDKEYAFDDECPNSISHLNPWWGELTMVHWILQTNSEPFVGNAQYRRYWNDKELANFDSSYVYFAPPIYFSCSLKDQFNSGHRFPGVEMTLTLAKAGKLPLSFEELCFTWQQNKFQGGPMLVAEWNNYRQIMAVLFDCLWPIWETYQNEIMQLSGYDARVMAFLSERLLSGIMLFPEKFLGKMTVRFSELHLST